MGALVHFWHFAQRFYVQGKSIPKGIFELQKMDKKIIEAGLAVEDESGIRARGDRDLFQWLVQKTEAGRRGGLSNKNKHLGLAARKRLGSGSEASSSLLLSYSNTNTAVATNDEKTKTAIAAATVSFERLSQQYPAATEELYTEGFKLVYLRALQEWDSQPLEEELDQCLLYYQQEKDGYKKFFFKFQKWLARSTRSKRNQDPFAFLKGLPDEQN